MNEQQLAKYAQVMINFALGGGVGIKPGEVVLIQCPLVARPLGLQIYRQVLLAGGHPIMQWLDDQVLLSFYQLADETQLQFFADKYFKGVVDQIDHRIAVLADEDPKLLQNIAPQKLMMANKARKQLKDWYQDKEYARKYTWSLCLYPTPAQAIEASLSESEFAEQIVKACYLNEVDPIAAWKSTYVEMQRVLTELNNMPIDTLNIQAAGTDLTIKLGEFRQWIGGGGRNIPSFEISTSPDWRGTNGIISFDLPLYRYGNILKGIKLEFKDGLVVKASAEQGEELLQELVKQPNANKIGEFSLTDKRFSKIDKFMANTLFDENFGGPFGNTHLALGSSYHDCYNGDPSKPSKEDWVNWGYNDSAEHTDIIATTPRTVTAALKDGSTKVIYQDGEFSI